MILNNLFIYLFICSRIKASNGKEKGNPTRSGCTWCEKLNKEDIDNERLLEDQQIAWDLWKNAREVSKNKENTKIVNSDK